SSPTAASASCSTTPPCSATSTSSRPARWSPCSSRWRRSSFPTSATRCSIRASGSVEGACDMTDQAIGTPAPKSPASIGPLRRIGRAIGLLRESRIGMIGAAILVFWVTMAIIAPLLPLYPPNDPIVPFQGPLATAPDGGTLWLGTDHKGRDLLSRIIWGSQRVLLWASAATIVAYVVGMIFGVMSGYLGGWWDEIISFGANVLLSFPVMVLYLIIITYLGASG